MYGSSGRYREEQDETIEQLSAEVEKKSQMLMEVKTHLKDMAERERERDETQRQVVGERDALKEQVELVSSESCHTHTHSLSLPLSPLSLSAS